MAKKPDEVRRAILDNRARIILGEKSIDEIVAAEVPRLLREWEAEIRAIAMRPRGKVSPAELERAVRGTKLLLRVGAVTEAFARTVQRAIGVQVGRTFAREVARARKFAVDAGVGPVPITAQGKLGVQVAADEAHSEAVIAAARSGLVGVKGLRDFSTLSGQALAAMKQDLVKAVAQGRGVDWLARRWARGQGAGRIYNSASVLARTAYMAASNEGHIAAWRAEGVVQSVRWSSAFDIRVCPYCGANDGQEFPLDQAPPLPAHFQCVLPDTRVATGGLIAASRARYNGDVIAIRTASGRELTITENHPLLTDRGFLAANRLNPGDYLVCRRRMDPIADPHGYERPAEAQEIFRAASIGRGFGGHRVPTSSVHLHGDEIRFEGEVEVVAAHGHIQGCPMAAMGQEIEQFTHMPADEVAVPLSGSGDLGAVLLALRLSAYRRTGGLAPLLAILGRGLGHPDAHRIAAAALRDPETVHPPDDQCAGDPVPLRDCLDRFSPSVEPDQVLVAHRKHYAGFVHDFSTMSGAYTANDFIAHNCRCIWIPVFGEPKLDKPLKPVPVPPAGTRAKIDNEFGAWIASRPAGEQRDFFGSDLKHRAFADGKLRMSQMVNADGSTKNDQEIAAMISDIAWLASVGWKAAKALVRPPVPVPAVVPVIAPPPTSEEIRRRAIEARFGPKVPGAFAGPTEGEQVRGAMMDALDAKHGKTISREEITAIEAKMNAAWEAFHATTDKAEMERLGKELDHYTQLFTDANRAVALGQSLHKIDAQEFIRFARSNKGRDLKIDFAPTGITAAQTEEFASFKNRVQAAIFHLSKVLVDTGPQDWKGKVPLGDYAGTDIRFVVHGGTGYRANANYQTNIINNHVSNPSRVIYHELGHLLEASDRRILKAATDFLDRRTKGEEPVKMSQLTGNKFFQDHEITRPDRFSNPYTGKVYADATEVVSMGLESLMTDPWAFAKADPEMFDLMIAIVRGKLDEAARIAAGAILP